MSFTDDVRTKLGVAEDADEATILAALDEALDERAEETPQEDAVPEGHVAIPEARLRDLETSAKAGADVAEKFRVKEREAFLDANKNKFAPANRDAWAKEYDRDPKGTREHFEKAPVIVPTDELGEAMGADPTSDDALYASVFGDEKTGV